MMNILINGEPKQIPQQTNAHQLIELMALAGKRLAMEVNQEILPRSQFDIYCFKEGDCVEIVHAIGGG